MQLKLKDSKDDHHPHQVQTDCVVPSETEQIVQLKRLLVTLKQHYENQLQTIHAKLQNEQNHRAALQKEWDMNRLQFCKHQESQEEELRALREQQAVLRDLLNKAQEEAKQSQETPKSESMTSLLTQDLQENKALESRYIEVLNEKLALEHQAKQWHLQLTHQSAQLIASQSRVEDLEEQNKQLQAKLEVQAQAMILSNQDYEHLKNRLHQLEIVTQEKDHIQEKLEFEKEQMRILLEEAEARLKVAQQHLAKKVKEATRLNEKMDEQQTHFMDSIQTIENQKSQLIQLQANIDFYQKQEKRLQEQFHEALNGMEHQVTKWEEKYFQIYDKWQESERRVQELKKVEEKHHQIQNLLTSLGGFVDTSLPSHDPFFSSLPESKERPSVTLDIPISHEPSSLAPPPKEERVEERYDIFGMRQPAPLPSNPQLQ
jgi:hypothetical protein